MKLNTRRHLQLILSPSSNIVSEFLVFSGGLYMRMIVIGTGPIGGIIGGLQTLIWLIYAGVVVFAILQPP